MNTQPKNYEIAKGIYIGIEPSHQFLSRIADFPKSRIAREIEERLSSELLLDKTESDFPKKFVEVTHKYGFAVVYDPDVKDTLFSETYDILEKLFSSDQSYLSRFGRPGPQKDDGYIPPATEISTSATGTAVANVFQFIHRLVDKEKNQQIDDELGNQFRIKSEEIIDILYNQVRDVAKAMAVGLREQNFLSSDGTALSDDYFIRLMEDSGGCPSSLNLARLTHCRAAYTEQKNFAGCSMAHTDLNFVTALPRPTSPLQLWYEDKNVPENSGYVELNTPKGSFTLNIGDQADILTSGYLTSTPHRVIAPIGVDRYSIILFGGLRREIDLVDKKLQHSKDLSPSRYEVETLPRIGNTKLTAEKFTDLRKMDIGLITIKEGRSMGFAPIK